MCTSTTSTSLRLRETMTCMYQSLVVALVLSRLDYGNATLAGLPTSLLNRLQSVINAAARSIAGLRRSEHITDALASFHWLRAPERIKFKLAVVNIIGRFKAIFFIQGPRYTSGGPRYTPRAHGTSKSPIPRYA